MKHIVAPAGTSKIAIAELQGWKRRVLTGGAADARLPVTGLKVVDSLFSVIGIDGDGASLAVQVVDFTVNCTLSPLAPAIEAVTLTSTDPVAIEITAHGLLSGEHITIGGTVVGTVELQDNSYIVTKVDADNFTLNGTNSANFTAWTSGGTAITKNAVIVCSDDTAAYRLMVDFHSAPNV